jgi:hypothetical protein
MMMNRFHFRTARPEDAAKVKAFNQRLAEAGESYHHLSIEPPFRTMKHSVDSPITAERLFCFEGAEIRGGVNVKRMMFRINGNFEEVAYRVYPLSEGIVNPKYGMIGLMIQKEVHQRYPLRYRLGAGKMTYDGSSVLPVPFHFTVLRAGSSLHNMIYLRKRKWMNIFLDLAAFSGVGAVGLQFFRLFQRLHYRYPNINNLTIERFDAWGDWADEIWEAAQDRYSLIGDRSKAALLALYPEGHEHLIKLRFANADTKRLVGWAVITASRMKNHHFFGNMVLGAIVDMLAVPEDAYSVTSGALIEARRVKADLVVVNHSDRRWNEAFKRAGMLSWKTNFFLSLSSKLAKRFNPMENYVDRLYFTRGDGHGPTSLWMADYHDWPGDMEAGD